MPKQDITKGKPMLTYGIMAVLLVIIIVLLYSNSQAKSQNQVVPTTTISANLGSSGSNQNYTSLEANYSMTVSKLNGLEQNYTALLGKYNSSNNSTPQEVVQVLYTDKTIHMPAPVYNPYYNYVIGCYWTDGSYNFSFYAPYSGYLVYNETNSGIPANFSYQYFDAYISTQKPRYFKPQPYNETSFCPGFTQLSTTEPWTDMVSYNNQTLIVPVKNGTNYILFFNGNANQQHGVNPFPINVTFSMTYYGFKGVQIPQTPTATVPTNIIPSWGRYGGS
jgi:hypothetical protein